MQKVSVQLSRSVVSDSCDRMNCRRPGFPVHHQLPELTQTHVHPTSVIPFSSRLQSFPASGSFQMSHFLASGGQNIEVSASASVFPMNIQDLFPLGWIGWMSLQSKGLSRVFSNTTVQKHQFFMLSFLYSPLPYTTAGKTKALTRWNFVDKVMSLLLNILSRLIITFLPRSVF